MNLDTSNRYQITLRMNGEELVERFFDSIEERSLFLDKFETDMKAKGFYFEQAEELSHFYFISFRLMKNNEEIGSLTIYK